MAHHEHCKNILLLYPATPPDTYWSYSHSLRMIGKKAGTPPLGLLTVAAMLPDDFSLRLIDMNVRDLDDADIEWADVVFVSAMIAQRDSMASVLQRVKTFGKTVVAGGPYSSSAYRELDNIDVFFIGEAEGAWDAFLADLRSGELKSAYAAPVREREYKDLLSYFGPEAHITPVESHPDVNLAPLPRFDLLDLDAYATMTVQASRGCPVGCEFCDIWRRYGRKTRIKVSQRILDEMDMLYSLGWRDSVFLVDDNFIGNRARAREVVADLVEWQREHGAPFTFTTEATLSLADDTELLDLMAEAGFASVFVGIETPSEDSLRETGKFINLTGSIYEKAAKIESKGIQLMSGFIIGFDADPEDIAERMTACIHELGIPQAMIGLLNALPDTDLYDRLDADNRIVSQTTGNNTHAFAMNFRPIRPEADILRDYKQVLHSAYPADMKAYFARCEVLRQRWPRTRSKFGGLSLGWKLKAMAKYLRVLAASPYRFTGFAFLLKSLVLKPSFMEQAFELGVKGHHHWEITRQAFEMEAMRTALSSHLTMISIYVQQSVESLQASFGSMLPDALSSGENALESIFTYLNELKQSHLASPDLVALRENLDEAVIRIARYGKEIQDQVEQEYKRLSTAARASLASDMEWFFTEINKRCALMALAQ